MSWDSFVSDKLRSKQYTHKSEAKKDVLTALKQYNDLHPQEDTYVHNDGTSKNLLSLTGTIPIAYKGNTYNIPIQIWLLTGHPFSAPLVFVRPTSSMIVKPSKHVDQSGRVYMPYLTEWRTPRSDTCGMMKMLQQIFSQDSPVYAKPSRPPPTNYGHQNQMPNPGYPTQAQGMPMPGMPAPGGYGGGYPGHNSYPSHNQHQPRPHGHGHTTPYPVSTSYQPPTSTYPPQTSAYHPPTSTPYQANYQQQSAQLPVGTGKAPDRQMSVIDDKHLRASLLTTAEDKLKRRVKEVFEMGKMEIDTLETTKSGLESGNRQLTDIIKRMDDEKDGLSSNVSLLSQKNAEMEDVLRKLENDSENLNIDEAVVTTAPLYNQILNLFAEENAVEDAIYYLGDALRREVVELDAYLKAVRSLSRKQFLLRATLQKARATAGLTATILS